MALRYIYVRLQYRYYQPIKCVFYHILVQFAAFVSQQPMLVGITLPLWAVNFHHGPRFGTVDIVATALCLTGMTISYFADTQLREFMLA
jgi:steroid 5-alpha reductase family enzyme